MKPFFWFTPRFWRLSSRDAWSLEKATLLARHLERSAKTGNCWKTWGKSVARGKSFAIVIHDYRII